MCREVKAPSRSNSRSPLDETLRHFEEQTLRFRRLASEYKLPSVVNIRFHLRGERVVGTWTLSFVEFPMTVLRRMADESVFPMDFLKDAGMVRRLFDKLDELYSKFEKARLTVMVEQAVRFYQTSMGEREAPLPCPFQRPEALSDLSRRMILVRGMSAQAQLDVVNFWADTSVALVDVDEAYAKFFSRVIYWISAETMERARAAAALQAAEAALEHRAVMAPELIAQLRPPPIEVEVEQGNVQRLSNRNRANAGGRRRRAQQVPIVTHHRINQPRGHRGNHRGCGKPSKK